MRNKRFGFGLDANVPCGSSSPPVEREQIIKQQLNTDKESSIAGFQLFFTHTTCNISV